MLTDEIRDSEVNSRRREAMIWFRNLSRDSQRIVAILCLSRFECRIFLSHPTGRVVQKIYEIYKKREELI